MVTIAVLCFLFILYRRAAAIRQVIAVKLRSIRGEGAVRLSVDGPSSMEFLADDYIYDEDVERLQDPAERLRMAASPPTVRTDGVEGVDPWGQRPPRTLGEAQS